MKHYIKNPIIFAVLFLALTNVSFGSQARILSDQELDQIHAGGLNLDFGQPLGNLNSTTDTVTKGGVFDLSSVGNTKLNLNNGVRVISIPRTPTIPTTPEQPNTQNLSSLSSEGSSSAEAAANALGSSTADVSSATSSSVASAATASPSAQTPDDMMVMVNMPTGGQMGVVLDGSSLAAMQNGSRNVSVLNVTDTAQQYLQALANVNAVNSTVPVQINMVVLVNSYVQNLNNSNTLSIDSSKQFVF